MLIISLNIENPEELLKKYKEKKFYKYNYIDIKSLDTIENNKCEKCKENIKINIGVPIDLKIINKVYHITMINNFCSFECVYKHIKDIKSKCINKQSVNYHLSEEYLFLLYRFIYKTNFDKFSEKKSEYIKNDKIIIYRKN